MDIRAKVVVITGASSGIGAACASEFHSRGARLALLARNHEALKNIAAPINATPIVCDITSPGHRVKAIEQIIGEFGRIDILINNAGLGVYSDSWSADMSQVRHMFEVNLFAALEMTQLAAPHMRRQRSGLIVNVASLAGEVTLPWFTMYSASKAAMISMTEGLDMELRGDGVHAMAVCPGYVRTPFQQNVLGGKPPDALAKGRRFAITPDHCARDIASGVERDARLVRTPALFGRIFTAAATLAPSFIHSYLVRMKNSETGS